GEIGPGDWSLFYARGVAYERAGDWQSAERDLTRALELNPDQPFVMNYLAYSWADAGVKLEEAEELLSRAVLLRPDDGAITDSLGWVLFRAGRTEEAVGVLERAAALAPADPVVNDHLGDAYWAVGRRREAVYQWRIAL